MFVTIEQKDNGYQSSHSLCMFVTIEKRVTEINHLSLTAYVGYNRAKRNGYQSLRSPCMFVTIKQSVTDINRRAHCVCLLQSSKA